MKLFKIALVGLLIIELICTSLFIYDMCSFYETGEWTLFPFMNLHQYKERDRYQGYVAACDYIDLLRENKNNLAVSRITNCVMTASFFCFPIYSILRLWTKRKIGRLYAAVSLVMAMISVAIIVFIRVFLDGSSGGFGSYEYIPIESASFEDAAKYLLIYVALLPLAYVFGKRK